MTQPSQPQPASTLLEPLYSYKQLHLEAETIVVGAYGIGAVYQVLKEIRDDERKPLLDAIAELDEKIEQMERTISMLANALVYTADHVDGRYIQKIEDAIVTAERIVDGEGR